jgi:hypothetical protein
LRAAAPRQEISFIINTNFVDKIEPALLRPRLIDSVELVAGLIANASAARRRVLSQRNAGVPLVLPDLARSGKRGSVDVRHFGMDAAHPPSRVDCVAVVPATLRSKLASFALSLRRSLTK